MAGRKNFVAGEILTAADVNSFLMDQSVMVFDDSAARTTAIPTPSEGMVTYRKDDNAVEVFDGSAFGPIGKILQVVSTTKTNTFSTSSTSFTAVTGLGATITPSATSSKVIVMATFSLGNSNTGRSANARISGGNLGFVGDAAGSRTRAAASSGELVLGDFRVDFQPVPVGLSVVDSPATTSATTYSVEILVGGGAGTVHVGRSGSDTDTSSRARLASSIILMEVAG